MENIKNAHEDNKCLPDILSNNLKILFVGFNPGIRSAALGHHYAGHGNRFWKLLYESGLTPHRLKPEEDKQLLNYGYGSTNIVGRPTKSAAELSSDEFRDGSLKLVELLTKIKPCIICYVGIGVYRSFASNLTGISPTKLHVSTGIQKNNLINGCIDYVCSNPSGLNTIPYKEQLACFEELKILRGRFNYGDASQKPHKYCN